MDPDIVYPNFSHASIGLMGKNKSKRAKSIHTSTIAYALEEIHTYGKYVCSCTIS